MSCVLILGDVHLGKGTNIGKNNLGVGLNTRIIDQLNILDWTLDTAVDNYCNHIVITGDIFEDPKPHHSIVTSFINWIKKCGDSGVHVHIVAGNHDLLRNGYFYTSPLDIISASEIDGCTVYNEIETIYVNDVSFTLMPFRDRKSFTCQSNQESLSILTKSLEYELWEIPVFCKKVVIGHLAMEGSIFVGDEVDDVSNELFCPVSMFSHFDYVWMGHVHGPQIVKKINPYIAHIGSMDISNFGETDQNKQVVIFNTINKSFNHINIPTRNLKKINISVPKNTENTTDFVINQIKEKSIDMDKSIVKIEISLLDADLKSVDRSEVEKFLYDNGAFNIAGLSESKKTSIVKKESSQAMDIKIDVTSAINMWAKSKWPNDIKEDEDKRSRYVSSAIDLYKEFLSK